jgi:hypothetical protein
MDESSGPIELFPREPTAEMEGVEDPFVAAGSSGGLRNGLPIIGETGRAVPLGLSPPSFPRGGLPGHVYDGCLNNLI